MTNYENLSKGWSLSKPFQSLKWLEFTNESFQGLCVSHVGEIHFPISTFLVGPKNGSHPIQILKRIS